MSRKYKFKNPEGLYFVTFATEGWTDVFTRNETSMAMIVSNELYKFWNASSIRPLKINFLRMNAKTYWLTIWRTAKRIKGLRYLHGAS